MQTECINIAFSTCGSLMAGIGADGSAVLWQRNTDLRLEIEADEKIRPDGIFLASGGERWTSVDKGGRTLLREFPSGKKVAELYAGSPRGVVLAFSPDGRWLVGTDKSNDATIFDAKTGKLLRRLEGHEGVVLHVAVSADGRHVVTSSDDGTSRIWEAESGKMLAVLGGDSGVVNRASFDRSIVRVVTEERRMVKGRIEGRIRVWSLDGEQLLEVSSPSKSLFVYAGFSPDGRLLATVSTDGRLRFWHAGNGKLLFDMETNTSMPDGNLFSDMFSPDGDSIAIPRKYGGLSCCDGITKLGIDRSDVSKGIAEDAGMKGKNDE